MSTPKAKFLQKTRKNAEDAEEAEDLREEIAREMLEEAKGAAVVSAILGGGQTIAARAINGENNPKTGNESNYDSNKPLTEDDLGEYLQTGQRQHVRNTKEEMLAAGNSPILTTIDQIRSFISSAINGKQQGIIKAYGKVGERMADDISNVSSGRIDIRGYYLELDGNRINHMADHVDTDADSRNIPLNAEEASNITQYIDSYDAVLDVITRKDGQTRIILCKDVGDGTVMIVELVSKGRSSLQPVTAWKNTYESFEAAWGKKNEAYYTSHREQNDPARGYQQTSFENNLPQTNADVKYITGDIKKLQLWPVIEWARMLTISVAHQLKLRKTMLPKK